jgi:hypothetical protein
MLPISDDGIKLSLKWKATVVSRSKTALDDE